jgi:hypothetical protein
MVPVSSPSSHCKPFLEEEVCPHSNWFVENDAPPVTLLRAQAYSKTSEAILLHPDKPDKKSRLYNFPSDRSAATLLVFY